MYDWLVSTNQINDNDIYYIAGEGFVLTPATANELGGIKVGSKLSITQDGTLSVNIPDASETQTGLMTTTQVQKLNDIDDGANNYVHPTYTQKNNGLYKITVDSTGHVSSVTSVSKSDITELGIPAQDTVYTHPTYTQKSSGLYKVAVDNLGHVSGTSAVTKTDITNLGVPAQDTVYTHPTTAGYKHIPSGGSIGQILENSASGTAIWTNKPVIDSTLSSTSTNAVQNKAVNDAIKALSDKISAMLLNADTAFDTFKEISDWVSTHNSEYEALAALTSNKVDKVAGKGLSTNDFTNALLEKLNGIADGANNYIHPSYTAKTSGLYKIMVDALGHISGTAAVTKSDITALGISGSEHTHDDRYYTETEIDSQMSGKADAVHTHSQYLTEHQDISGKSDVGHTHAISDVTDLQTQLDSKVDDSEKGTAGGIATLDSSGKVPEEQLPAMSSNAGGLSYRIENAVFQVAGWAYDETRDMYKYQYQNANITSTTVVNVMFTMTSLTYANVAGVQQECFENEGYIEVWSNAIPAADLVSDILIYGAVSSEALTPDAQTAFSTQMSELGTKVTTIQNNIGTTKMYYSLAQVDATLTVNDTMDTIFTSMATNSMLHCYLTGASTTVYPSAAGILTIVKVDANNGSAQFQYEGKIATGNFTA